MKTFLISKINGAEVEVHATTDHPESHYGKAVWVDEDGIAYCQVGMESPFYQIKIIDDGKE